MATSPAKTPRLADRRRPTPQIYFLIVGHTTDLMFNPLRPEGLVFEPPGEPRLSLRPVDQSHDAFAFKAGLECKVSISIEATDEQAAFVKALRAGRFQPYGSDPPHLPHIVAGEECIDANGSLKDGYKLSFGLLPLDLQTMCDKASEILSSKIDRFVTILRWTQNFRSPHGNFIMAFVYWSTTLDGPFDMIPSKPSSVTVPGMTGVEWTDAHQALTLEVFSNPMAKEPLAHELLREAVALSAGSPRSGLLMAATALETGVKAHVAKVAPDTEWLLKEMQSPAIFKILRDFVPDLHRRLGTDVSFWRKLLPTIKKVQIFAEHRNRVAHTGQMSMEKEDIEIQMTLVSDILYILDVLEGFQWARTRVSPGVRKSLGWPDPIEKRVFLTMRTVE